MKKLFLVGLLLLCTIGLAQASTIVSQGLGSGAYTASSTYLGHVAENAFDGDFTNMWNSGGHPTKWIEVDLGALIDITQIMLSVEQLPSPASTYHEIWTSSSTIGSTTATADLSHIFSGVTLDGDLLSASFSSPLSAQFVQIRTTSSPSWVAWNEIQVMAADPVPEPATMLLFGLGLLGLAGVNRRKK